jgi:DNA primase
MHAKMLKRVCNEVILCYDSDNAGREATEKAFRILSPQGISVRVAALPQGEDPDSLIRKQGADALRTIVTDAPEFLEHQIRHLRASAKGRAWSNACAWPSRWPRRSASSPAWPSASPP